MSLDVHVIRDYLLILTSQARPESKPQEKPTNGVVFLTITPILLWWFVEKTMRMKIPDGIPTSATECA